MKALRILNLEDNPLDTELIRALLTDGGITCEIERVQTRVDFVAALEQGGFDLILSDYTLPSFDGLAALKISQEIDPELPFIIVSGTLGEDAAIESLTRGATDYVLKHRLERLVPAVRRVVREAEEHIKRKRAEEALRRSEERLRLAVESTRLGTWDFNPNAGDLRWDERCKALFGLPPEAEVDYGMFLKGLHPEDREWVDRVVQRTLEPASGGHYDIEFRTLGIRDGIERWVAATGQAFFDEVGRAVRFIGTVLDITERKRAEEALRETRKAERSRIARDLHDGALQDLSYALTVARLIQRSSGDPQLKGWLDQEVTTLTQAVHALRSAVYDLRSEEEGQTSIVSSLEDLAEQTRRMASGQFQVELKVEEGFPETLSTEIDTELVKIVQEALNNARRHSAAKDLRVDLTLERDVYRIEVSDDGRGFEPASVRSGVGLSSMRERAESIGGRLKIESEEGQGTKVRIWVSAPGRA